MHYQQPSLLEMSNTAYHADTARISASGLKYIHRSPAHFYAQFLDPNRVIKPPTPAMLLGTYVHCAILEPERFAKKYVCADDTDICAQIVEGGAKSPRSTGEYKRWLDDFKKSAYGKEIIAQEDYNTCTAMRNAVWELRHVAKLLEGAVTEKSILFIDEGSGAACKARPDAIKHLNGRPVIIEVKTCENASPAVFGRQVVNYGYHNQAAFYIDGFMAMGMSDVAPLFVFLAIEKEPPYASALYYSPDDVLALGRSENAADLRTYSECLRTGRWPGYADVIRPLQFPQWALKQVEYIN